MYFNFDNYLLLSDKIVKAGDEDDRDELKSICKGCLSYVESVHAHEKAMELIRFRYDADELKDRLRETDANRHYIHEAAIVNCKVINRLATLYEVGEISLGNPNNRFEVADFCMEVAVKTENYIN